MSTYLLLPQIQVFVLVYIFKRESYMSLIAKISENNKLEL